MLFMVSPRGVASLTPAMNANGPILAGGISLASFPEEIMGNPASLKVNGTKI